MKLRIEKPKKTILKVNSGDGNKKPLTYEQINQWSDYVEANPGKNLDALWVGFNAKNPKSGISYDVLKGDLTKLIDANRRMGEKLGSDFAQTLHTGYSFPRMVVGGKDMGRVNADLKTQTSESIPVTSKGAVSAIPKNATEVWFDPKDNIPKYVDPESGDIKYATIEALLDPRIRKSIDQQKKDAQARNAMMNNSTTSILNVK